MIQENLEYSIYIMVIIQGRQQLQLPFETVLSPQNHFI